MNANRRWMNLVDSNLLIRLALLRLSLLGLKSAYTPSLNISGGFGADNVALL